MTFTSDYKNMGAIFYWQLIDMGMLNVNNIGVPMLIFFIALWVIVIFGTLILVGISKCVLFSIFNDTSFYYDWANEFYLSFKQALIGGTLFGGWIWLRAKYLEKKKNN